MWTKAEKGLDPLFVGPSSGRNHLEVSGYFKYHHMAAPVSGAAPSSSSCVLWKANSARRKRFGYQWFMNDFARAFDVV
ncbi:unnamed protein product [Toxocara canis]|uniref:Uncharacterized protein n=1 Tax=Toxocara canis TaxID=6265 RepID=A0A183V523_TOXCA|nr:unnamed protein product [Toxocara canis]